MGNDFTDSSIAERLPITAEIIGPAGAGKTTLIRALNQRDSRIQIDFHLSKIRKIPFFISNTFYFLPTFLRQYRHSEWFNWRETRSMVYLKAGLHVLSQQGSNNDVVTILDHGPIYRLAFLRALGPEITISQIYKRWWTNLLDQWAATINIVIWLDAPNSVLLERIHSRDKKHTIKEKCVQEAHEFLTHYRTFLSQTIAELAIDRRVALLHFDTNQKSMEQIVNKVLAKFESPSQIDYPAHPSNLLKNSSAGLQ